MYKVIAASLAVFFAFCANAQDQYHLTDLGPLNGGAAGGGANAYQTNAAGTTVGFASMPDGSRRPWTWTGAGGFRVLASSESQATGINSSGQVAGSIGLNYNQRAAFWDADGTLHALGAPAGYEMTLALGINNAGVVAGITYPPTHNGAAAWVWEPSNGFRILHGLNPNSEFGYAINNSGAVVGSSGYHAALWAADGTMTDLGALPAGGSSYGTAISDAGHVVGYGFAGQGAAAFLWTQSGGMIALGNLPGGDGLSVADGVNSNGTVVGIQDMPSGEQLSFVWDATHGMRQLSLLVDDSGLGWALQNANGINDQGVITGQGIAPDGQLRGYVLTPIPAPASSLALLALCAYFRRRDRGHR